MKKTKAVIVGGGIGGLATAIALDKIGLDYVVLEQASQIREVGAGISIWSNGLRCLNELGVEDQFLKKAVPADGVSVQNHQGKVLREQNFSNPKENSGISVSTIYRPDLINILLETVSKEKIFLNSRAQSFVEDSRGVTVKLTSGKEFQGDLLIGADGLHSVIRKGLLGNKKPRYAGYTCWRGLVTMDQEVPLKKVGFLGMGPGSFCGFAWLKERTVYWFAVVPGPTDSSKELKLEILRKAFLKWSNPIRDIINRTPPGSIIRNDIRDFLPVKGWGRGRITLLGDAAHATTPNLAQGACMALEDAVELACSLFKYPDNLQRALRLFEKQRYTRTADLVRDSRFLGQMSQWRHPFLTTLRNTLGFRIFSRLGLKKYAGYRVPRLP